MLKRKSLVANYYSQVSRLFENETFKQDKKVRDHSYWEAVRLKVQLKKIGVA